jgi:hypothetical protein
VPIEEITRGLDRFQELLTAIDDFSQEGFPYRDAARAKAELQLRECVRRIFGERSPEFQTYRNYKLRTSNKTEVAQTIATIKTLMKTLEDRKLELQGLKPPPPEDLSADPSSTAPPQMALVPPSAQVTMATQRVKATPPMTVSVAMTTNLGTPTGPGASTPLPPAGPIPTPSAPPPPPSQTAPPPIPLATPATTQSSLALTPEPVTEPSTPQRTVPPAPPSPTIRERNPDPTPSPGPASSAPPRPQAHSEIESVAAASSVEPARKADIRSDTLPSEPAHPKPAPPSRDRTSPDIRSIQSGSEPEPLHLLRKVCLRFHSVARQLRLRKDYRATLEVEDDYDLQDLLCALLKVEFDEVGTDEWTPPYTGGAPRTTLLLNKDLIAVVAKKTRPGLSIKEIADQIAADSAYYRAQDKCATLFFFIYDPEGRIGSPKRLETNLTSVSERCTVEVLVAPK